MRFRLRCMVHSALLSRLVRAHFQPPSYAANFQNTLLALINDLGVRRALQLQSLKPEPTGGIFVYAGSSYIADSFDSDSEEENTPIAIQDKHKEVPKQGNNQIESN